MNKKYRKSNNKKFVLIGILAVVVAVISFSIFTTEENSQDSSFNLVGPWSDLHGVGMFLSGDDTTLYLATHQGLFKQSDSRWQRIGNDNADLMGFSIGSEPDTMYSSGHPKSGGNLGFRVSKDGGESWMTISKVKDNPVDFHAMTASMAQKGLIYGSPGGGSELFVSLDEGTSWVQLVPPDRIISLAADPLVPDRVYAGTVSGLYVSNNKGVQWDKINSNLEIGVITGIGFSSDGSLVYIFSSLNNSGFIAISPDGGQTLVKTPNQIPQAGGVWNFSPGRNGEVYAIAMQKVSSGIASSVYVTNDRGTTWELVGTNSQEIVDIEKLS